MPDKIESFVGPYGITKLSELPIDIAKDWDGYKIQNIGTPTADTDAARKADTLTFGTIISDATERTHSGDTLEKVYTWVGSLQLLGSVFIITLIDYDLRQTQDGSNRTAEAEFRIKVEDKESTIILNDQITNSGEWSSRSMMNVAGAGGTFDIVLYLGGQGSSTSQAIKNVIIRGYYK